MSEIKIKVVDRVESTFDKLELTNLGVLVTQDKPRSRKKAKIETLILHENLISYLKTDIGFVVNFYQQSNLLVIGDVTFNDDSTISVETHKGLVTVFDTDGLQYSNEIDAVANGGTPVDNTTTASTQDDAVSSDADAFLEEGISTGDLDTEDASLSDERGREPLTNADMDALEAVTNDDIIFEDDLVDDNPGGLEDSTNEDNELVDLDIDGSLDDSELVDDGPEEAQSDNEAVVDTDDVELPEDWGDLGSDVDWDEE